MRTKIIGPPGCGKTTSLLSNLEREIENGVSPERIAFLTFTRAARLEALERTQKTEKDFPFLKTIHSICYHNLGIGKDEIVRPEDVRSFGSKIGIRLSGSELDPWIEEFERGLDVPTKDDMLLQINHYGRHKQIMLKEALRNASTDIDWRYATWFTEAYRSWKTSEGLIDYTDLLTNYVEMGEPLNIDVLFVDEAQDLSKLQWRVVNILGANAQRIYTAGDDDQAIFNWAGADSSVFQNLEADKVEVLGQSYRVSKAVHRAAAAISSRIKNRLPKSYSPTESEGEVSPTGYLGNVDFSHRTFILFRNHYRRTEIAALLNDEGIPFIGKGSPLTNLDARAAILAWAKLTKIGEAQSDEIRKMLKFCDEDYIQPNINRLLKENRGLRADQVFLRKVNPGEWYRVLTEVPGKAILTEYIKNWGFQLTAYPKVELMSIHQSKGREAHTVVIDPEMSRAVWMSLIKNPDDEHRVWYVALTRAKERVFTMVPDGNFCYVF